MFLKSQKIILNVKLKHRQNEIKNGQLEFMA